MRRMRPITSLLVESAKVWGLVLLVVAVGFVFTYQFVEPPPPGTVRIATGGTEGAYYGFARKYAALLARDKITLEIVSTAGSVENLELLKKGEVSLALVQGGSAGPGDETQLQSLGSMFLEPVWVFTAKRKPIKRLSDLQKRRVAVGAEGSGTHLLAMQLLRADGFSVSGATLIREGSTQSVELLRQGKADAAFFVASPTAPMIRALMQEPAVELFAFTRAAAYTHLYPYLTAVTINEGVMDLARNIPDRDTTLVAVAANLVARRDLNSNLIPALMKAVTEVHREGGVLEMRRQFPTADLVDLPLDADARHYIINGPSFFFRWLPYTAAVYLDRLKIMLLPFIALLIPLFRFAPQLYRWRVRSKIYRWYAAVREIDTLLQEKTLGPELAPAIKRIREIEKEVASVSVPLSYTGELYHLRMHIRLIAEQLANLAKESASKSPGAD